MTLEGTVWRECFTVRAYEVNSKGLASAVSICNYLQEVAGNHARSLGFSVGHLFERNLTWVLARMYVELSEYPKWQERIQIETWPAGVVGLYANRDFRLFDASEREIGIAKSFWIVMDTETRRPVRVPPFIQDIQVPARGPIQIDSLPSKLKPPENPDHFNSFEVRYRDLDINQHVNNVAYMEWVIESTPAETLRHKQLRMLDIIFRAETAYGDQIASECQAIPADGKNAFIHRLLRKQDSREIVLARTEWSL